MWKFFCGLKTVSELAQHVEYLLSLSNEIAELQRAESANISQILQKIELIRVIIEKKLADPQKTHRPGKENDCLYN
jgi:hypothetical protein